MTDISERASDGGLPAPENKRHYPGLDGLRALAVLMVFVQHYLVLSPRYNWGWTGVRIFFVLSGFLITGILYDTRNAARRWSVFYTRRALRIFPLYYAVLLLGVLTYPLCKWALHPSYLLWPLYLQNFSRFIWPQDVSKQYVDHLISTRFTNPGVAMLYGHFWSLCIEEQFYLVWPLVVFAVKRRETLMRICLLIIVLSPLARLWSLHHVAPLLLHNGFEERFTFLQCDGLLLGAYFALWMRGPHPSFTLFAKGALACLLAGFCFWEWFSLHFYGGPFVPDINHALFTSLGFFCINLGSLCLVLLAIDPNTSISRLLQFRALRWLGSISYGFYVFHDIPHVLYAHIAIHLYPANPKSSVTALVGLVGTLVLASASYYGFERPFLRLKSRFNADSPSAG